MITKPGESGINVVAQVAGTAVYIEAVTWSEDGTVTVHWPRSCWRSGYSAPRRAADRLARQIEAAPDSEAARAIVDRWFYRGDLATAPRGYREEEVL